MLWTGRNWLLNSIRIFFSGEKYNLCFRSGSSTGSTGKVSVSNTFILSYSQQSWIIGWNHIRNTFPCWIFKGQYGFWDTAQLLHQEIEVFSQETYLLLLGADLSDPLKICLICIVRIRRKLFKYFVIKWIVLYYDKNKSLYDPESVEQDDSGNSIFIQ